MAQVIDCRSTVFLPSALVGHTAFCNPNHMSYANTNSRAILYKYPSLMRHLNSAKELSTLLGTTFLGFSIEAQAAWLISAYPVLL